MMTKEGFEFGFDESGCAICQGYCCTGEEGYIWLSSKEIEEMSDFLGLDRGQFLSNYCLKVGYKYSLKESFDEILGHCCIFFDKTKKMCSAYPVRPKQCRDFPFWDSFKNRASEVYKECPYTKKL